MQICRLSIWYWPCQHKQCLGSTQLRPETNAVQIHADVMGTISWINKELIFKTFHSMLSEHLQNLTSLHASVMIYDMPGSFSLGCSTPARNAIVGSSDESSSVKYNPPPTSKRTGKSPFPVSGKPESTRNTGCAV